MNDETNETPAPLSDAEIAEIMGRATYVGSDVWEISEGFNGRIGSIGPIEGYDGDALGLREGSRTADFVAHAPNDIARLLATLAARHARLAAQNALINEAAQALEEAVQIRAERDAMREIVAAVADGWSNALGTRIGETPADGLALKSRARALLAGTPAPAMDATAGEDGEA